MNEIFDLILHTSYQIADKPSLSARGGGGALSHFKTYERVHPRLDNLPQKYRRDCAGRSKNIGKGYCDPYKR